MWPDLAKFRHFGNFMMVYFVFDKNCYLLWQILYTIGQFFMVVNGQIMKPIKAIWSYWSSSTFKGISVLIQYIVILRCHWILQMPCWAKSSYQGRLSGHAFFLLACIHPVTSCRAGWIFHPSTSLGSFGSSKLAALCMQARITCTHSFYLGIDDFACLAEIIFCTFRYLIEMNSK